MINNGHLDEVLGIPFQISNCVVMLLRVDYKSISFTISSLFGLVTNSKNQNKT